MNDKELEQLVGITNRRVLEIQMPEITGYPLYADFCAILQCHPETKEWLLSNFLQLCSNSKALMFYDFNYKACPFLCVQRISKRFLKDWGIGYISFIMYNLEMGNYVYLMVKKRYIDAYYSGNSVERMKDENIHNILIFGYDKQQQIFYIADNFYGGKYSFSQCTCKDMEQAIVEMRQEDERLGNFDGNIELIRYKPDGCPELSVQRIIEGLSDYLYCRPTGMWNIMEVRNFNRNRIWYFGLDCYDYIINEIKDVDMHVRIQDFHVLWEHKTHLKYVFQYLVEKKYINTPSIVDRMGRLSNDTLKARDLILKYKISGDDQIKKRVIEIYRKAKTEEERMISDVISNLDKCNRNNLMSSTALLFNK